MTESAKIHCGTCHGTGTVASELGPEPCRDCEGIGLLPSALVRTERRLRELERTYGERQGEVAQDVRWLVTEMRRSQHALVQILAASQDASDDDPLVAKIRFLANEVLGVYPLERA